MATPRHATMASAAGDRPLAWNLCQRPAQDASSASSAGHGRLAAFGMPEALVSRVHGSRAGRGATMIALKIPSRLEYRDLAIRVVASTCKLLPERGRDFDAAAISAFSEALNNVILHGYGPVLGDLEIEIEVEPAQHRLTIRIIDYGKAFDPAKVPVPDLDSLPESGMGVFIMRSFMDSVTYLAGVPNILSMTKFSRKGK